MKKTSLNYLGIGNFWACLGRGIWEEGNGIGIGVFFFFVLYDLL